MKAKNFTENELKEYFNNWIVYFLNYNKVFRLVLSKNAWFYFEENIYLRNYDALPYTKRGRFHSYTFESIQKLSFIDWIDNLIK